MPARPKYVATNNDVKCHKLIHFTGFCFSIRIHNDVLRVNLELEYFLFLRERKKKHDEMKAIRQKQVKTNMLIYNERKKSNLSTS